MMKPLRLLAAAAFALVVASPLTASAADHATEDCSKLKSIIEQGEQKIDEDAKGFQGAHIHTLIHTARLVANDSDAMARDVTNAHITSAPLATYVAEYAGVMRDLGGAMRELIAALEPIAGKAEQHTTLVQRIQAVTTDVSGKCQGDKQPADCQTLLTKLKEFPKDQSGGPTGQADRLATYANEVLALHLTDASLKKDAQEWAAIAKDMVTGLRGVAAFQAKVQALKTRGETAGGHMKDFCSAHQ